LTDHIYDKTLLGSSSRNLNYDSLVWKLFCVLTTYDDCDIDIDHCDPIERFFA